MFKLFKTYYSLNKTERRILNLSFLWLIYSVFLVRLLPLRWFQKILGEIHNKETFDINDREKQVISIQKKIINKLKKRLPWNVKCFEEAIAAKKVLEKFSIKSTIFLGVAKKEENKLIAHAWLKCNNIFITGEKGHKKYSVVAFYS